MAGSGGIKISYPGYDVRTAADWQLVFNSDWPSIQIAFETTVTTPYTRNNNTLTIPHNLGFYPLAQCWLSVNGVMIYEFYTVAGNFTAGGSYSNTVVSVSQTNVYPFWQWQTSDITGFDPFGNVVDGSLTASIHVKCYNLDISKAVDYTNPQAAPARLPYDPRYGVKVVKKTRNIASPDLRDFILHSRGQTPAVLNVQTQAQGTPDPSIPGNVLIQYTNTPGFTAWFFGFHLANFGTVPNPDMRYTAVPVQPSGFTTAGADVFGQNVFQVSVPSSPGGSLVVLRNPLFTPNNIFASF